MTIALSFYAKVINNICLAYYGLSPEYVVQLGYLRKLISHTYNELNVSVLAIKSLHYLSDNIEDIELLDKSKYAYIKEIRVGTSEHPLLHFIKESNLKFDHIQVQNQGNKFCLICPTATQPSKSMTNSQLEKCYILAKERGYCPIVIGTDVQVEGESKIDAVEQAGCVIGVENEYVFLSAVRGIKSILIPSGPGTDLFRMLFPDGEIYERI